MANLSYCAFANTSDDMRQCLNMLMEAAESGMGLCEFIESRSSREEGRAVERLISLAEELLQTVDEMEGNDGDE